VRYISPNEDHGNAPYAVIQVFVTNEIARLYHPQESSESHRDLEERIRLARFRLERYIAEPLSDGPRIIAFSLQNYSCGSQAGDNSVTRIEEIIALVRQDPRPNH
jgi:hypothetical protein